jgi:hypothetical protein
MEKPSRLQRLQVYEETLAEFVRMKADDLSEVNMAMCPFLLYKTGIVDMNTPGGTRNYLSLISEYFPEFIEQRPKYLWSDKDKMRWDAYLANGGERYVTDGIESVDKEEEDFVFWFPLTDITSRIIVLQNCIDKIKNK